MTTKAAETQAVEPTKPRRPSSPALPRNSLKLRESTNNTWRAIAPRGTPRERLLDSDFWSVVSESFLAYDVIAVIAEDRSYYAELLVLECGRGYASLVELNFHPLPALLVANDGLPPNHEIVHLGPDDLYGVRRCSDGVMLGKGFASRDEALAFLLDHATLR